MKPVHVKGTDNIADYLSRCLKDKLYVPSEDIRLNVNRISSREIERTINRIITEKTTISLDRIRNETANDPNLKLIIEYIKSGSIRNSRELDPKWLSIKDDISLTSGGILVKEDRIVIPKNLEKIMLNQAHESCMGISLTSRLLKQKYFWPKMDYMIKEMISSCLACQACTDTTAPKPIIPSILPKEKFTLTAVDFSSKTPEGKYILVLIDEFSRYPILKFTAQLTSKAAIQALDKIFNEYGVPKVVKTDNGPAFISNEFKQYAKNKNFKQQLITPEHPQSNSIAERFMSNINKQIRCAKVTGEKSENKIHAFVRDYRETPHSTTNVTPNDLMERTDNRWPSLLLKDRTLAQKVARLNDEQNKLKMVQYANQYQHVKIPQKSY